jgi:hypothetical protein
MKGGLWDDLAVCKPTSRTNVARQQIGEHVLSAEKTCAWIELLDTVFYMRSVSYFRVVRGNKKGTQCPGVQLGHPVAGRYKYGNLTLQVWGASDETPKYGYGFCATRIVKWLYSKLQTHPIVKEGTLHEEERKVIFRHKKIKIWLVAS